MPVIRCENYYNTNYAPNGERFFVCSNCHVKIDASILRPLQMDEIKIKQRQAPNQLKGVE